MPVKIYKNKNPYRQQIELKEVDKQENWSKSVFNTIACIELQGLEQGIKLAVWQGMKHVEAQTDSSNVVTFIKGSKHPWPGSGN
ncbi:hypothetical protein FRX31_017688 [Thalictrum thalictroides]|uniref:RNase H type-1 domain-containing protein n=1 Tax=Thalictrum thalictroides TaxID=46969 RepID=A0A7J6W690_THATH|nr:hypothetical protein FRX31_017688 [Thalictrum thalictroides]